jgi:hypothetical protein
MQRYRFERSSRASELAPSRNFDDEDDALLPPEHAVDHANADSDDDDEAGTRRRRHDQQQQQQQEQQFAASCTPFADGPVRLLVVAHGESVRDAMRVVFPHCKSSAAAPSAAPFGRVALTPLEPTSPLFGLPGGVVFCPVAHSVSRDDAFALARVLCGTLSPLQVCVVDALSFDDRAAALLPARDRSALFFVETPAHKALAARPDLAARAQLLDSFVFSGVGAAFVSHCALRNLPALLLAVDAAADGDTSDAFVNALHVLASIVPPGTIDVARAAKQLAKPTPVHNALFM